MQLSEKINDLAAALATAQGEIENASKNAANPHFKSKYADLAEVINCVRPVFSKHGLAFAQCPSYDSGVVSVETIIFHKSGQYFSSTVSAPVSKQDAQGVGSAITYCRRYALAAMAGISQEDDDANAAVGKNQDKPKYISHDQAAKIDALAREVNADVAKFLSYMKVGSFGEILAVDYAAAIAALEAKRGK